MYLYEIDFMFYLKVRAIILQILIFRDIKFVLLNIFSYQIVYTLNLYTFN